MSKIKLHTPRYMQDQHTTTEYEVGRIVHVKSVVGNDEAAGTEFWIKGLTERQFCTESANAVKQLMKFKRPWIGSVPNWLIAIATVGLLFFAALAFYLGRGR